MSNEYDDLARRAENGELAAKPGTVLRGEDAAAAARRLLADAVGAPEDTSPEDLTRLALGRPTAGKNTTGESPVIRARVPQALKDRVTEIAKRDRLKESDILRMALAAYVAQDGHAKHSKRVITTGNVRVKQRVNGRRIVKLPRESATEHEQIVKADMAANRAKAAASRSAQHQ